jgi:site-specific DNA recombinase
VPTVGAPVSDGYDGPPRVVAYIRVSHERVGMVSPELQLAAIDEVCQPFGYALVSVISDPDRSGLFWKRRQVEQAVEMIEAGGADILMVWKWSRIARNRRDWAIAVDRIESAGGRLESATEPVDASTSSGRLAMLAEFAAFEADRVGDMWREAHNRRIRHGLPPSGRPHYGYRYVDKGYLPDPVTGPALAEAHRRYNRGDTGAEIARWLLRRKVPPGHRERAWTGQSLIHVMDNGFAAGLILFKGEFYDGIHQPLISQARWAAYRAARERRKGPSRRGDTAATALLTGMVRCRCGSVVAVWKAHPQRSAGGPQFGCAQPSTLHGPTVTVSESVVNAAVMNWLRALSEDLPTAILAEQQARIWAQQRGADARALVLRISALDPDDSRLERDTLLTQMHQAREEATWHNPHERARALLEDWDQLDDAMRRDALRPLVGHIEVNSSPHRLSIVPAWQPIARQTHKSEPAATRAATR